VSLPSPREIVFVVPSLRVGGAERVATLLCEAWKSQGHRVRLVIFDGEGAHFASRVPLIVVGSKASRSLPGKILGFLKRVRALRRIFAQEPKTQLIVSFMESANFPSIAAAALTGSLNRLVVSVRNHPGAGDARARLLMRFLYRYPRRVVSMTHGVADYLNKVLGLPRSQLGVIANPIDPAPSEAASEGEAVPDSPFVLGLGRLEREKGFDRLIEAFALVSRQRPHLRLLVLGEGSERSRLEAQVKALGLAGRVSLPGKVKTSTAFLKRAELLAVPSRSEGWSNAINEALLNRCPVVAMDCDFGPREILRDGESGLLVQDGDLEAFAAAILRVTSSPELRDQLRAGGTATLSRFEMGRISQEWLKL